MYDLFLKFTVLFGQPVCVILYAVFSALAARYTVIPLLVLVVMHLTEYCVVGFRVAKQNRIHPVSGFLQCLCFGFTWWLPLRNR